MPTRAPRGQSSSPATPHSTSSAAARAGAPSSARPSAALARQVLGRVHRQVDLASQQRRLELGDPARLVADRLASIAAGHDRDDLRRLPSISCRPARPGRAPGRCAGFRSASALATAAQVVDLRELPRGGLLRGASSRSPNSSRTSSRLAWPRSPPRPRRRIVGSCSRRLATARATASMRAMSRGEADSQRPEFSASTCSTTALACSRSALTVGQRVELAQPAGEAVDLLLDDLHRPRRLLGPRAEVARDDRLQVVDVVQGHALQLAAGGVDVARHGDVDQQQRPSPALAHHQLELLAADDRVRRGGRGEHDVGEQQLLGQVVQADDACRRSAGRG